ncbi:hypothetical protein BEWA_021370 [Theileria equi strain WA]|uniref:TLC domain-containing protein n=1 Tax=Theileria equi strain WA TaxID=1537102 RepID=L0AWK3_THEEQ|nr:hypothetical protein BEWA_021370 [Theileria equi strain WA]AFZ79289.1 hypothetical protein BEWA_021370 [Theileria equi strain WA]|eukprot:XP_004828955.1 hypothetical protein BEWA_021370 [Theileria equi strain WA]
MSALDFLHNALTVGNTRLRIEKDDRDTVIFFFMVLSVVRLVMVGVNNASARGIPSLVPYLLKKLNICHPKKKHKLAESLWFFTDPPITGGKIIAKWPLIVMSPEAKTLILMCTGFWISCLVYINWETRRSDMEILRFHHITTILLIIVAHIYNFYRISLLIILFHDVPDVLLYATKSLSYTKFVHKGITTIFFVLYGLSHFLGRFILLSKYIVYPLLLNLDPFEHVGGKITKAWELPGGIFCPISIICLTIMNIYWLNLIIKVFRMAVLENGDVEDIREEDDD